MSVLGGLETAAPRLGFYALVSLLERLLPSEAPIGGSGPFTKEPLRFRHDPSLSFSAADVTRLVPSEAGPGEGPAYELATTFMGLTGFVGPLPSYFAEEIAHDDGDAVRRDFLDLFHHRLLSLLFRGLAKYDLAADSSVDGQDPWSKRLLALEGVDAWAAPVPLPVEALLRLAPLFSTCRRPAEALEIVLTDVLGTELGEARVEVIPFTGGWVEIEPSQRMRLGRESHQLGETAVLGQRIFDRAGKFTVRLAPLGHDAYRRLMPGGDLHARVASAVTFFSGNTLEFDFELGLAAPPSFKLAGSATTRLGRDTWLAGRQAITGTTLRVRGLQESSIASRT